MKRMFSIQALWDDEAKVYYSESDISGLHIETRTLEEFEAVMHDVAADLIFANHISMVDMATMSIRELVPTILWQRPDPVLPRALPWLKGFVGLSVRR